MKKVSRVISEIEAAISSKTNGKSTVFRVRNGKASIAATETRIPNPSGLRMESLREAESDWGQPLSYSPSYSLTFTPVIGLMRSALTDSVDD